jgi:RNA polymerase sigma-70 factor (ECF subfamily)
LNAPVSSNPSAESEFDASQLESRLIAATVAGDRDAFTQLVRSHEDAVFNMSYRMLSHREDARDVCQEIFLTVFNRIREFRGESRFGTWIFRIAVNRCRDELRRRKTVKHTRPVALDLESPTPARGPSPEAVARGKELERIVSGCIASLPDDLREMIVLRDVQDLAYEEMAHVLEVPMGTVRSRLSRARSRLAELLEPMLAEDS